MAGMITTMRNAEWRSAECQGRVVVVSDLSFNSAFRIPHSAFDLRDDDLPGTNDKPSGGGVESGGGVVDPAGRG